MGKMIDVATAAAMMRVNVQRMRLLCRHRRVPGARLVGRVWMIPEDFKVTAGTRGDPLRAEERTIESSTSLRALERAAKAIPDQAVRQQRLDEISALREAGAMVRKVRRAIKNKK